MIQFIECQEPGYKPRTIQNANADVTLAIATNFDTAGERLTKSAVQANHKEYIPVPYDYIFNPNTIKHTEDCLKFAIIHLNAKTMNIAGNGIYTIGQPQALIDDKVLTLLTGLFHNLKWKPTLIRSGGQSGIDEAGLKAAVRLEIPALCLAPKGWIFRDANHKDVSNEELFKARFNNITK